MLRLARLTRVALTLLLAFGTFGWIAQSGVVAQETGADQPLVAFTKDGNLWLMNADGSEQRPLTEDGTADIRGDGIHYQWYEWSPDGQYLLILKEERRMDAGPPTGELLVYDTKTGEMQSLIDDIGPPVFFPSWALDANQIAFVSADPLSGTGDAYALSAVDLDGAVQPLAEIAGPSCNLPSGNPLDPAYQLHVREFGPFSGMILDRTIFWRATQQDLWFDTRCGTATYVDVASGEQTDTGLDQIVVGPGGQIAGLTVPADPGAAGADLVIASNPVGGDQRALRTGETPSWAMLSGDLFFVTTNYGTEFMALTPAEEGLEPLNLSFNRAALWMAPADGSEPAKLVDRAVYAFGEPSPAADGSFVVLTRIENSAELWENRLDGDMYTQALLDEHGPRARIQRYDAGSGELSTLAMDAFRPKVQPRGVDLSDPPTVPA